MLRRKAKPGSSLCNVLCALLINALVLGAALAQAQSAKLVDVNTADQKALEALPGVGPSLAQEIIQGRPYKTVDDLANVKGVGKGKLDKLRGLVTVGAAATGAAAPPAPAKVSVPAPAAAPKAAKPAALPPSPAAPKLAPGTRVNINTANQATLETLPGVGAKKAEAIIAGRPYGKPEDIMKVKGIKEGVYDKIKDMITVR